MRAFKDTTGILGSDPHLAEWLPQAQVLAALGEWEEVVRLYVRSYERYQTNNTLLFDSPAAQRWLRNNQETLRRINREEGLDHDTIPSVAVDAGCVVWGECAGVPVGAGDGPDVYAAAEATMNLAEKEAMEARLATARILTQQIEKAEKLLEVVQGSKSVDRDTVVACQLEGAALPRILGIKVETRSGSWHEYDQSQALGRDIQLPLCEAVRALVRQLRNALEAL